MSSAIQKLLTTEVLEVHKEACKNYGNQRNVCEACVDACDHEAVLLDNGTPMIIDTKCIDCGACVGVCFVNAIDHLCKPYTKVKENIKNFPKAHITCDQVEEFNQGIKVPCLLYLDVPLLSQYAFSREGVHIYIGHCHDCRKVTAENVIIHLNNLQQELKHLGFSLEMNKNDFLPTEKEGQMVDAVSRRDIFKSFSLTSIRELLLPSTKKTEISEAKSVSLRIGERILLKKEILNELLQTKENGKLINSTYFSTIEVSDQCNGCNVCVSICPTKALRWEDQGEISHLMFESTACVSCDKCQACPKQALTILDTSKNVNWITNKQLISMIVSKCSDCGETFKTVETDETRCFFCKANSVKDPLRFFRN